MANLRTVKCVVVGDGAVGKTCLLMVYSQDRFPEGYVPTIFENYDVTVQSNNESVNLSLWDTAGQEDYAKLRPLSYEGTDVFLVCFSVDNRTSFDNIKAQWIPEIRQYCPNAPAILVGTKSDLRTVCTDPVPSEYAKQLVHEVNAYDYIECSAKTGDKVKDVFELALECAMKSKKSPDRSPERSTENEPATNKNCCIII